MGGGHSAIHLHSTSSSKYNIHARNTVSNLGTYEIDLCNKLKSEQSHGITIHKKQRSCINIYVITLNAIELLKISNCNIENTNVIK